MAVLGSRENPIKLDCSEIKNSDGKIDECVIKSIQRKLGLQGKVFKDKRYKYVVFTVKMNNCSNCSLGCNKVTKIVLPKTIVKQKMAIGM